MAISSGVQGVAPFLGRYTIDTHHTPGYAAGYLASKVQPRLFVTTRMPFDPSVNEETVAEIRHHWDGPFHFGAPDGVVVDVTKDKIWTREEALPPALKQTMGEAWRQRKAYEAEMAKRQGDVDQQEFSGFVDISAGGVLRSDHPPRGSTRPARGSSARSQSLRGWD